MFDKNKVKEVAKLAMIELDDKDITYFSSEIIDFLKIVEQTNDIDLSEIEPLYHAPENSLKAREDEVDINPKNLCMNEEHIIKSINKRTKAVFLTHIQGFNGLSENLLRYLKKKKIELIEDVCESHGAKFKNKRLGSYGLMSNFSFYSSKHINKYLLK